MVTGASSGIGAATARALRDAGFDLVLGARRLDRLATVAEPLDARAAHLDVTDTASVERFCNEVGACRLLVNNAGGAIGFEPVAEADEDAWRWMFETNVAGVMRMTRALLPALVASGDGHVITIGSVAAIEPYPGGAGYNAAKFGARAVMGVLRRELLGQPVRITEIDPGMVGGTEFSSVRFRGDEARAAAVYEGVDFLTAADVADCVAFAATRPGRVNIDSMLVMPRDQAAPTVIHRRPAEPPDT